MDRSEFLKLLGLGAAVIGTGSIGASKLPGPDDPYFSIENLEERQKELTKDYEWEHGLYTKRNGKTIIKNLTTGEEVEIYLPDAIIGDVVRWKRVETPKQSQRLFATKATD